MRNINTITYLIYVLITYSILFIGTGYAVFVLDKSGWWFVLTIIFSGSVYAPERWALLNK